MLTTNETAPWFHQVLVSTLVNAKALEALTLLFAEDVNMETRRAQKTDLSIDPVKCNYSRLLTEEDAPIAPLPKGGPTNGF